MDAGVKQHCIVDAYWLRRREWWIEDDMKL